MFKKILLVVFLIVIPIKCYATTNVFKSSLIIDDDKIITEGYVNINIKIDVNYKLKAISGVLEYDKTKLFVEEINDESKFDVSYNLDYDERSSFISGVYTKGLSGEFVLCSIKFKKTNLFVEGDKVIISLKDVKGSDDTRGIANDISVYIPKASDDVVIIIDDEPVNEKNYVTEKDNVNVVVQVKNGSVISGNGNVKLNVGDNNHQIVVEDDKGNKTTIDMNIVRQKESNVTTKIKNDIKDKKNNINIKSKKKIYIGVFFVILLIILFILLKKKDKY